MLSKEEINRISEEGSKAYTRGISFDDCPYYSMLEELEQSIWRRGWILEAQKSQNNKSLLLE